jgi:predicted nucleic acid-binding Zn ribbon protein
VPTATGRRRHLPKALEGAVKLPKFLRVCPVCALPFYTPLTTQVYCSRRCRNTAAVRRYRQRKKEAMKDGVPHVSG